MEYAGGGNIIHLAKNFWIPELVSGKPEFYAFKTGFKAVGYG
jgi:hypothetical protein